MIRTERCPVFVFRRLTAHLFCGPEPLPHHFFLRTGGIFYQAEKNVRAFQVGAVSKDGRLGSSGIWVRGWCCLKSGAMDVTGDE